MKTLFIALRALIYMTGFVFLWAWIAMSVRAHDQGFGAALPAWMEIPGIVLMALGGIIALVCAGFFIVQGKGTPAVFDAPREFVAAGLYRYVRNPMYIGGLILLIGFGLLQRSISILLLSLAFFSLVHLFVVFYEEPNLKTRFGANYKLYCQAVRRWIPRW